MTGQKIKTFPLTKSVEEALKELKQKFTALNDSEIIRLAIISLNQQK